MNIQLWRQPHGPCGISCAVWELVQKHKSSKASFSAPRIVGEAASRSPKYPQLTNGSGSPSNCANLHQYAQYRKCASVHLALYPCTQLRKHDPYCTTIQTGSCCKVAMTITDMIACPPRKYKKLKRRNLWPEQIILQAFIYCVLMLCLHLHAPRTGSWVK